VNEEHIVKSKNNATVQHAFGTLFDRRDYAAAETPDTALQSGGSSQMRAT